MKHSHLKYLTIFALGLQMVSACKKGFLEADPLATQVETNYYKNAAEAFNGLVAAYDPMGWEGATASGYANFATLEAASDDCYGGGGSATDVPWLNTMDSYNIDPANGPQLDYWKKDFTGVSRTNFILSRLEVGIPGLNDAVKGRYIAEAKFLRAYYYFELVRLFGRVPLITAPLATEEIYNVVQSTPQEVYAFIEKD
jgi:hypothetical protein